MAVAKAVSVSAAVTLIFALLYYENVGSLTAVNSEAGKGQMMGRSMAGTDPNAKGGKKAALPKMVELPKKYQDPESSGITTTTAKGVNKFDIMIPK